MEAKTEDARDNKKSYHHNELVRRSAEMSDRIEAYVLTRTMGNLQSYQLEMMTRHLKDMGNIKYASNAMRKFSNALNDSFR